MTEPTTQPAGGVLLALARLEAIVRRAIHRANAIHGAPSDDAFRGLHLAADDIARTLERAPGVPLFAADPDEPLPDATPTGARLTWLAGVYGLSEFDVDALLIALGPDLDLRYERIYAYLQDDVTRKRPTIALILNLLCRSAEDGLTLRARFTTAAPLLRHRVIVGLPESPLGAASFLATPLKTDDQIIRFLLAEGGLDSRLATFCRLTAPSVSFDALRLDDAVRDRIAGLLAAEPKALTLCFHGRDEAARTMCARATAAAAGRPLLVADLDGADNPDHLLPVLFREAQLHGAALLLEGWESTRDRGGAATYRDFLTELAAAPGLTILSGARDWTPTPLGPKGVVSMAFPGPAFSARRACWTEGLTAIEATVDPPLVDALAARFRLTEDQISNAVLTARNLACARQRTGTDGSVAPTAAEFFAAARSQSGRELSTLATHIDPIATWDDIVLPDEAREHLREVCARMSLGYRVLDEWGFNRRLSYGKGITALFSGPSGTGKTMAAEVIANELGLKLYRIDLSAVVSKWIGETEKNLDRLFHLADNVILFFDEADALFGKRSEVREAHDRYANVEISYLLQKMEAYDGLAILATNMRHHMDEAFLRRLAFVIHFPFPDDAQRREIWERIWPAETPLADDVDFGRLARTFKLSGGNVKNIALAAAFAAAEKKSPVGMAEVVHAIRREYQKLGKILSEAEIAGADAAVGAGSLA